MSVLQAKVPARTDSRDERTDAVALSASGPMTPDEERATIVRAQAGDRDAVALLVTSQMRYLRAQARTYAQAEPLLEADDMLSAGIEGLLGAIQTFDPARGVRLYTHAAPKIAEKMDDEKAAVGRAISVPGRTLRKYRRAIRETETIAEARALAAERDRMDPATFDAVHFAMTGGVALDASRGTEGTDEPIGADLMEADRTLGSRGPAPEGTALSRAMVAQGLAALSDFQRRVVLHSYLSGEAVPDAAVAASLGVSKATITRTRNAALQIMRDLLA